MGHVIIAVPVAAVFGHFLLVTSRVEDAWTGPALHPEFPSFAA
jgi:hypothetical protein